MKIFNLLKSNIYSKFSKNILFGFKKTYIPYKKLFSTEHKCDDPNHNHSQENNQNESIKSLLAEIKNEEGKNIIVNNI